MPRLPKVKKVPLRVISYTIDERYHRYVVLNNGDVFVSRAKGVSGDNYHPWVKWDLLSEINQDME